MNIQELIDKSNKLFEAFNPEDLMPELELAFDGAKADVRDKTGCGNYCWFPGFVETLQPKQMVELGGAMGVGDICILHKFPKDSKLYSITLAERGLEFCFIKDKSKYPNFYPIVGDDLDLGVWPKDLDLSKTDVWYIDSEHSEEQLRKELELYKQFFKKGAIVLFDDIHLNPGMNNVWNELDQIFPVSQKVDLTVPLHWSGWGLVEVG